jgi:hypothetical protein
MAPLTLALCLLGSGCYQRPLPASGPATRCYTIAIDGWYAPPMTRDRGPYRERPAHYHGIPEVVQIRFLDGVPVDVKTVAPELVSERWSLELRRDTLHLGWPHDRIIWALLFDLVPRGRKLEGETWYWSHVLGLELVRVPTMWAPARCPQE